MHRRTFLAAAGSVALAGCGRIVESEQFQEFEQRTREEEIDVLAIGEEERRWVLEFYPRANRRDERIAEIATIAEIYAETAPEESEDEQHRQLDMIVFRADGQRVGSMSIGVSRARQYRRGEIELGGLVLRTIATSNVG